MRIAYKSGKKTSKKSTIATYKSTKERLVSSKSLITYA